MHSSSTKMTDMAGAGNCCVTELTAAFRAGQVFLQWHEPGLPAGAWLNVHRHTLPITDATLPDAVLIGHHIQPGSARDWWQDPSAFNEDAPRAAPVGFVLDPGRTPLAPGSGLFVHTVTRDEAPEQYYAVTLSMPDGTANRVVILGENSLRTAVHQRQMPIQAIWCGRGDPPRMPIGLPVVFRLAGGAGANDPDYNYLAFGDASMGWRESLPFKFKIKLEGNCLNIFPSDRVWFNRRLGGPVSHFKTETGIALHFGYNSKIYDEAEMAHGTIVNYNEKRLLWILDWVNRTFQTDRHRVHAIGASGGGAGLMLALHHPTVFASVCARVPCVSYKTADNSGMAATDLYTKVLRLLCGEYDGNVPYAGELGGFDHLDGAACLEQHGEFPFLVLTHGRKDRPTPWSKVPSFYRALNRRRVGFFAWWDDGEHSTVAKNAPDDVKQTMSVDFLLQFSKNASFPVFSDCSDNKRPGNGNPEDGDIVGWMNRGIEWSDIKDTHHHYSIAVRIAHPDVQYPVTANITICNAQKFRPPPAQALQVLIGDNQLENIFADKYGIVMVPGVAFHSTVPQKIEVWY